MNSPMDIIILAGQSNAVGYGCGETDYQLKHLEKMLLLYDDQAEDYTLDENGSAHLEICEPWKIKLIPACEGHTGSLAVRFADAYIENGYLAPGRKLLIVRCAVGGTGFSKALWGVGQLLYRRMLELISYALSLHNENRTVAFCWHQGECDAFENPDWSCEKREESYYNNLKAVVQGVRAHCQAPELPFLCGGFTDEWSKDHRQACDAVIEASRQVCADVKNACFTDTRGLLSNNQKTGNGDVIHFCKDAVYTIGQRYFENYKKIMRLFIGIDLGTSAMKLLLMDGSGKIYNTVTKEYPLEFPKPGWSQQDPEDWKNALLVGVPELLQGFDGMQVAGIGCGGQMHGLVVLDENDQVIRPAILWNDGRTAKQVDFLNDRIGKEKLSGLTANIAFAGFTAPKLLWMKENEPENFDRIAKIMLPKDYINYILTGVHSCDYSDASGMLLLDVEHKRWSREMLDICCVSESQMPKLFESFDCIGTVKPVIAKQLGLRDNVKVAAGAGDNAAAAVGTGVVGNGGCNISLGTSGTVFISSEKFGVDDSNGLHAFAHADGGWHLMGCMLSAASCNKWLLEDILGTSDHNAEQAAIREEKLGENYVFFLPYLMGERSPINDTKARSMFIGMTMDNSRADMVQAVLEGVAFAIRDSVEVARDLGIEITRSKICGGGAKSLLWKRILANVLNCTLELPMSEQGPGMGGAMLAMVACGEYTTVKECCEKLCAVASVVKPEPALVAKYEARYRQFQKIYPAVKALFPEIQ